MLKAKELRTKSKEELEKMLKDERAKLSDLNFKLAGSQVKKVSEFGHAKKNIAIILTVLRALSASGTSGNKTAYNFNGYSLRF